MRNVQLGERARSMSANAATRSALPRPATLGLVGLFFWILFCEGATSQPAYADLPGEPGAPASVDLPPFGGDPQVAQVGTVGGMLTVDPTGAANYSIPIEVPPGRGGIQPRLALAYSSGSGNGYLGIGWTLAGLSTIERCSSLQRTNTGAELCLDGQPLIAVTDVRTLPEGVDGTEYRTEPDTGVRARKYDLGDGSSGVIEVQTPDGRVLEYRQPIPNWANWGEGKAVFTLNRASDAHGNAMTITWNSSPEGVLVHPLHIDYTSNEANDLPATKRVTFVWDMGTRPDPIHLEAPALEPESIAVRLERVEVHHLGDQGANVHRTYELEYDDEEPVTLLTSVRECVNAGSASNPLLRCKPPTRFDYLRPDPEEPYQDPVPVGGPGKRVNPCQGPFAMDLDRDGRQDLVYGHQCGRGSLVAARLKNVDGYTSSAYEVGHDSLWPSPRQRVSPVTVDNDGRGDMLHLSSDRRRFHVLSKYDEGTGKFASEDIIPAYGSEVSYHVAFDDDGDGLTDILSCELVSGRWYWVGYDGKNGYSDPERLLANPEFGGTHLQCDQTFVSLRPAEGGSYSALTFAYTPPTEDGGGWRRTFLSPVEGSGSQIPSSNLSSVKPITGPNLFLDANGDGVADGLYFYDDEDEPGLFEPGVRLADVDGTLGGLADIDIEHLNLEDHDRARWMVALDYNDDGFEDLMWNPTVNSIPVGYGLQTGNWVVAMYDPLNETFDDPIGTPILAWWDKGELVKYAQPRVDGDFNGDGRKDIAVMDTHGEYLVYVRSEPTRGGPALADDEWEFLWTDDPADYNRAHPYLLWRATNGFGATQSVRYGRTAQLHRYRAEPAVSCPSPTRCVVPNQHVVTGRRLELDDDTAVIEEFEYADARVNLEAGERVPFGRVETRRTSTAAPGQVVTSVIEYRNEYEWGITAPGETEHLFTAFPLASLPARHTTLTQQVGARDVARDTTWEWDVEFTYRGGTMPVLVSRTERTYDEATGTLAVIPDSPALLASLTPVHESGIVVDEMDAFGNPLVTRVWMGDRETTITRKFEPDLATWSIHRLMEEVVDQGPDDPNLTTSYTYYDWGGVESIVRQPSVADQRLATVLTYDVVGNVESIRHTASWQFFPEERVWQFHYDADEVTYPVQAINPLGHVSETFWDPILGAPLVSRDAFGIETRLAYDAFGRPLHQATVSRSGETLELDVEMSYHRLAADPAPAPSPAAVIRSDSLGGEATTELDPLGRTVRREWTTPFGTGLAEQTWTYDAWGRVATVSQPNYVGTPAKPGTVYTYDALGRMLGRELPNGGVQRFEYERRMTKIYDAEDNPPWIFERNALGLVERVTDARGTQFCYTYDLRGNLDLVRKGCQDPKPAEVVDHDHDVLGRLIRLDDPAAGVWQYAYDGFDQLRIVTDAAGTKTNYDFDELGRIIESIDPDETRIWEYDEMPTGWVPPAGWVGGAEVPGYLVRAQSSNGHVRELEYDEFGRTTVMREVNSTETFETLSAYDEYGRLRALSYPGNGDTPGRTVLHEYGSLGELREVRWAEGFELIWKVLDMDAAGRVTRERFGNGIETLTQFQELGGVERITTGVPNAAGWAQKFQDLSYTYTDNGNVWTRTDHVYGGSEMFGHDELNRLVSVTSGSQPSPGGPTWEYDDYGNIIYHSEVGEMQSEPNGRLLSVDGDTVEYDDNGQLTSLGTELEIDYFASGQPATMAQQYNDIFFEYDAEGGLARREVDGLGWHETVYAGGGAYQRERSWSQDYDEIEWKVFAYGRVVGVHRLRDYSQGQAGGGAALQLHDDYYPHADAIGSVNLATNEDSDVAPEAQRSFDAWGVARPLDWDGGDPPSFGAVDLGFTGHRATTDDGLVDMGARHYDPTRKRFVSPDPVVAAPLDTQSWNRYAYVRDNPLSFTDPTGTSWCPGPFCDRPNQPPPLPPPEPPPGEPTGVSLYNSASNGLPGSEAPAAAGLTGAGVLQYLGHRALTGSWGSAGGAPGQSMLGKFAWSAAGTLSYAVLHPAPSTSWFEQNYEWAKSAALEYGVDAAEATGGFVADYYTFLGESAVGYGFYAYDHFTGLAEGAWWAANNPIEAVDAVAEATAADIENVFVQVPAIVGHIQDGNWSGAGRSYYSAAKSVWSTAANVVAGAKAAKTIGALGTVRRVAKAGSGAAEPNLGFRSGRGPHEADVTIYRDGNVAYADRLQSGAMTAQEAALGFPRSTLATHTEARAATIPLQRGDTMIIEGKYPPCPSCKGAMNQARKKSGAEIHYLWEDRIWSAGGN